MSAFCKHCGEPIEQRPPLGWMHSEGKGSWVNRCAGQGFGTGPGYKYATPRLAVPLGVDTQKDGKPAELIRP